MLVPGAAMRMHETVARSSRTAIELGAALETEIEREAVKYSNETNEGENVAPCRQQPV